LAGVENEVSLKAEGSIENMSTSNAQSLGMSLEWVWHKTEGGYFSFSSNPFLKYKKTKLQNSTESIREYGADIFQITYDPDGISKNAGFNPYIAYGYLHKTTTDSPFAGSITTQHEWLHSYKAGFKIYPDNKEIFAIDISTSIKYRNFMKNKDSNSIDLSLEFNISNWWNDQNP